MIVWFLAVALAAGPRAETQRIQALIESLAPKADRIVVDGAGSDWAPFYKARSEGAVRAVSVAPTPDTLHVWVELAEPLRREGVWLALDGAGTHPFDGSIRIDARGAKLRVFGEGDTVPLPKAKVAVAGRFVEVSVDWKHIHQKVSGQSELSKAPGHTVRVRASRWAGPGDREGGLAVASYLLSPRAPRLDPPSPKVTMQPSVPGRLPFQGTWFVAQGAFSDKSHKNTWAYDFVIRDEAHHTRSDQGKSVQGVIAWDQPVISPGRGTVRKAIDGFPDRPLDDPGKGSDANRVRIDFDDGTRMTILHLRQGSVAVHPKQRVQAGALVGRVGNSGMSSGPHIHASWAGRDGNDAPVRLQNVVVQLNLRDDDPWARHLDEWAPSDGFFVRPAPAVARK